MGPLIFKRIQGPSEKIHWGRENPREELAYVYAIFTDSWEPFPMVRVKKNVAFKP